MRRRALIGSLTLAVPCVARAQLPARKLYRIGILGLGTGTQSRTGSTSALLRGMRALGYVVGEHFVTERRAAEGKPERFPNLAAELVRLQVDAIVAAGPALPALKQATSTIPIVMAAANDPVGSGYVQSLGRPGGNITGLSLQSVEAVGKQLELLKELVPGEAPVAVFWDRDTLSQWRAAETAAQERGWKLLSLEIRDAGEIEGAFTAAIDARAGALLVFASGHLFPNLQRVVDLAAERRLPAMYHLRPYVEAGGLISYGADVDDLWRRAATYVDKILKGANPADLPVEQPTKFDQVINLKCAQALGLSIPPVLLARADEVIE